MPTALCQPSSTRRVRLCPLSEFRVPASDQRCQSERQASLECPRCDGYTSSQVRNQAIGNSWNDRELRPPSGTGRLAARRSRRRRDEADEKLGADEPSDPRLREPDMEPGLAVALHLSIVQAESAQGLRQHLLSPQGRRLVRGGEPSIAESERPVGMAVPTGALRTA